MGVFVGRAEELRSLGAALDRAVAGTGALALVSGEAGIGKTTLASRIAADAAGRGVDVLWGRCVEFEGTPVYWAWRQVLRDWAESRPADDVAAALGPGAADVARIAPELGHAPADVPADEDDDARFRLFDAVAQWLRRASKQRPMLVVLEDLHWADSASLRLLEFLAAGLSHAHALVIATYRDTDVAPESPLATALGGALRPGHSTPHISLTGLSQAEVAALARESFGDSLADAAPAVTAHTAGNPLFATEVLRLLGASGPDPGPGVDPGVELAVPATVTAVILDRVRRVGGDGPRVLTLAAVLGSRFSARVLVRQSGGDAAAVEKALDAGCRLTLVVEDDHAEDGYRFVHDLVREALYNQVPRTERRRYHAAAAEAIEADEAEATDAGPAGSMGPEAVAAVAAHLLAAGPEAPAVKAVRYAAAAADDALRRLAFDEAVALYRAALDRWPTRDERRVDLLASLGDALSHGDRAVEAKEAFLAAADEALALGDAGRMARSLLGIGSGRFHGRPEWEPPVPALAKNLELLGDRDPALRSQLVSRMADMVRDRTEAYRLAQEGVRLARASGDPTSVVLAVGRRFLAFPEADGLAARRQAVDEMLAAAEACGDPHRLYDAKAMLVRVLLEAGELDAAVAEAQRLNRDADAGGGSILLRMAEHATAVAAILQGRFDTAQEEITALLARATERGRTEVVWGTVQIHLLAVLWHQGVLEALHVALSQVSDALPPDSGVYLAAGRLLIEAELGNHEAARSLLHGKVGPDLAAWEHTWGGNDMVELAWVAEACGLLRDATFAERLHELLLPAADRMIVAGMPPVIAVGWGALPLGIIAGQAGRFDDAERFFAEALRRHQQMGAEVLVARTEFHWARAAADAGAVDRARSLAASAEERALRLGMAALAGHAARLAQSLDGGAEATGGEAVFRREGEFWTVCFDGATARLRDSKGLRHLAELLAHPGVERHALELAAAAEGAGGVVDGGGAGPVLDAEAKAAYRRRIEDLRAERDEATAANDIGRLDRIDSELDALAAQLSAAVGLGGRDRDAAAPSERARISVSKAVKTALSRIDEALPALGAHLRATVRTGTYCSYTPDPRSAPSWRAQAAAGAVE